MTHNRLFGALVVALVCLAVSPFASAACKVIGDGDTAPAWTSPQAPEDAATVSAVGSATIDGDRLPEALAAARTNALKELAERIRVSVSSSVKLNDSKVSEGGKQVLRSSIESVAEATTNVTLQKRARRPAVGRCPPLPGLGACVDRPR